jgi:hypothetical protein
MTRAQLEHVIRAAATIADDTEIVVIGSQAERLQAMALDPGHRDPVEGLVAAAFSAAPGR